MNNNGDLGGVYGETMGFWAMLSLEFEESVVS